MSGWSWGCLDVWVWQSVGESVGPGGCVLVCVCVCVCACVFVHAGRGQDRGQGQGQGQCQLACLVVRYDKLPMLIGIAQETSL